MCHPVDNCLQVALPPSPGQVTISGNQDLEARMPGTGGMGPYLTVVYI